MQAKAKQPKVPTCEMYGFTPVHLSYGVEFGMALVGSLFFMTTAVATASAQSLFGIPAYLSMDHAGSCTLRLHLSHIPFCGCDYGADASLVMPSCAR